jgi:hypothetical protein
MERAEQKMKRRIQKWQKWFEPAGENGNQA